MNQAMKDYVASILPAEDIKIREPLDRYTSFRTGGEADCMLLVNDAEQLGKLLKYMR